MGEMNSPLRNGGVEEAGGDGRYERRANREIGVPGVEKWSGRLDFAEKAVGDVVDEAANGYRFGNPWMGVELL
jgi:hypothetical protein